MQFLYFCLKCFCQDSSFCGNMRIMQIKAYLDLIDNIAIFSSTDASWCANPSTCLNEGICIDQGSNFTCNCSRGFEGRRCEIGKHFVAK